MYVFLYRKISSKFINDLSGMALKGESIVLLGPRRSGKRYIFSRLSEQLESEGIEPIVNIQFHPDKQVMSEKEVYDLLLQATPTQEKFVLTDESKINFFEPLDHFYNQNSRPVVLMVGNVDRLPQHLARRFLEEIRVRVEDKRLVVILKRRRRSSRPSIRPKFRV